ncbi:hypothetical protein IJF93_00320 [Candidatus Saccharibacteria bacterium]|nr:hypothetical protein [Candidatus Saccharibacteria bacterium]
MDNNTTDAFASLQQDEAAIHGAPTADDTSNLSEDEMLANLTNEETIDLFIRGIMQEKGIDSSKEAMYQDIYNDLKASLLEQIDRSLVSELPEDKLEELGKMAAENGQIAPDVIAQMIIDAGLDASEITGATMARFREIYLGENTPKGTEE